MVKFGLIPEFIGRLPVIGTLSELDKDALVNILTEPKNALTKQFNALLELDGVELEFSKAALEAIAIKAMKRKTGARGLRSIVENILLDTMYDLPSIDNVKKVLVDEETVERLQPPKLIYSENAELSA